jgi:hypothetical protein
VRVVSVKGRPQPPHVRERIRRGLVRAHERRRAALRVVPSDLARLQAGDVAPSLAGFLADAQAEAESLMDALGGADRVSPQRSIVVADLVRAGLVLRAQLAMFLRTQDPDAGSRVGSLLAARRASLVAVGLDRVQLDALDLDVYAREHAERAAAERKAAEDARGAAIEAEPVSRAPAADEPPAPGEGAPAGTDTKG